ncbi:hypothetical protein AB0D13_39105 [Streptomyces sp. NPDC048430]|uniref:hypothetical protein n=1 Tax=Streptomyces sp. NPDC048430 TaxID=3155388 RepID=UPI00343C5CBD
MTPDVQRDLIPSDDALHLIGTLNVMKDKLLNAAEQWQLLDENGDVPATPSYPALLQHAADAQNLSHDVLRLTADFARSPHPTTRAGSTVLRHLATAATISSHAACWPTLKMPTGPALKVPITENKTAPLGWSQRGVCRRGVAVVGKVPRRNQSNFMPKYGSGSPE